MFWITDYRIRRAVFETGVSRKIFLFLFPFPGWPLAFPNCLMIEYGGRFPKPGPGEDFFFFLFPLPGRLWAFPNSLITEYGGRFPKPGFGERFFVFLFFSFPFARMAFGLSELFDDRIRKAVSKTGVGRRFFLFSFPVTRQTVSLSEFLDYRIRRAVSKTGVGRKSFFQAEPGRKPRGTWMKKQRFFPRKQPGREAPLLEGGVTK